MLLLFIVDHAKSFVCVANTRHKTVYKWFEKRMRGVIRYIDPEHTYFSSGVMSPKRSGGNSKISSNRQASSIVTSKVYPEAHNKELTTTKTLEPVQEVVEYLPGESADGALDAKVEYSVRMKSGKSAKLLGEDIEAATGGADLIEMKLMQEAQAHPLEEIVDVSTK